MNNQVSTYTFSAALSGPQRPLQYKDGYIAELVPISREHAVVARSFAEKALMLLSLLLLFIVGVTPVWAKVYGTDDSGHGLYKEAQLVSNNITVDWEIPETVILGQPFSVKIKQLKLDDTIYTGVVNLARSAGSGTLAGSPTATADNGVAVFTGLTYDSFDSFTLEVTIASNPPSDPSPPITATSNFTGGEGRGDDEDLAASQGFIPFFVWQGGESGSERDWFTFANWSGAENLITESPDGSADQIITIPGVSQASHQPFVASADPQPELDIRGTLTLEEEATLTVKEGPLFEISSGAIVTTEGSGAEQGRIILESGARYVNLSDQIPLLQAERQLTGSRGWRMIASPVATDYADFTSEIQTQGFPNADLPEANPGNPNHFTPNFMWWDETDAGTTLQGWRTLNYDEHAAHTTPLDEIAVPAGRGHFYFNFDGAGRPDDNTQSYTDALPLTMQVTGIEPNLTAMTGGAFTFSPLTFTERDIENQNEGAGAGEDGNYIDRIEADQGWNLVGNPTASALDWTASGWTKANLSNTIYVWDPSANSGAGDYLVSNGSSGNLPDDRIAPWQAFWVQATAAAPALSFTNDVKTTGEASFLKSLPTTSGFDAVRSSRSDKSGSTNQSGDSAAAPLPGTPPYLPVSHSIEMHLHAGGMQSSAWVMLSDEGKKGRDRWDAFRLEPLSDTWISASTTMNIGGPSLVINSLPSDLQENIVLPLYPGAMKDGVAYKGTYELEWALPESLTGEFFVYLMDHEENRMIDMRAQQFYSFGHEPELNMLPKPRTGGVYSVDNPGIPDLNGGDFGYTDTEASLTAGNSERRPVSSAQLHVQRSGEAERRAADRNSRSAASSHPNRPAVVYGLPGNIAFRSGEGAVESSRGGAQSQSQSNTGRGTTRGWSADTQLAGHEGLGGVGGNGDYGHSSGSMQPMGAGSGSDTQHTSTGSGGGAAMGGQGQGSNSSSNTNTNTSAADMPRFTLVIGPEEVGSYLPIQPQLMQNYPNPFNPGTTIRFALPNEADVRLEVFDILGRRVATLVNGRMTSGLHEVYWDASRQASGVYLYRMVTSDRAETRKMTLVK